MGSIIPHRIDYNWVGALISQRHIPSKHSPKYAPPPPPGNKHVALFKIMKHSLWFWIPCSGFRIPCKISGTWILSVTWAELQITKPRIDDSRNKNFPDFETGIALHWAKHTGDSHPVKAYFSGGRTLTVSQCLFSRNLWLWKQRIIGTGWNIVVRHELRSVKRDQQ